MENFASLLNSLRQFIREIVDDSLAQYHANKPNPVQETKELFMDVDELQNYLPGNPPKATIYRWCCKGLIPFHKLGRHNVFKKSEIDCWLDLKRIPTVNEIGCLPILVKKGK